MKLLLWYGTWLSTLNKELSESCFVTPNVNEPQEGVY